MEIIKELNQSEIDKLRYEVMGCFDRDQILDAINKEHLYQVHLYADDFNTILINSSIEDQDLPPSECPIISEVIDSIKRNPDFLNKTDRGRKLDGKVVAKYCEEFRRNNNEGYQPRGKPRTPSSAASSGVLNQEGNKPESFFLVDRDDNIGMNPKGTLYVRDGMHHLVAYGLTTDMNENAFPIIGYYSSNKKSI